MDASKFAKWFQTALTAVRFSRWDVGSGKLCRGNLHRDGRLVAKKTLTHQFVAGIEGDAVQVASEANPRATVLSVEGVGACDHAPRCHDGHEVWVSEGWVGGGEEEERLPVEIQSDTSKFCYNWLRSKVFQSMCQKMLLTFWKVKHCKGGGRGSTVGGSKATTNKSSRKSRKNTAASRNKNTSRWNFGSVRGFFSGYKQKGKSIGKSIVKLFLTFCKSRRGFHTTASDSTRRPPQEKEERMKIVAGVGKKVQNFGRSGGGRSDGGSPGFQPLLNLPCEPLPLFNKGFKFPCNPPFEPLLPPPFQREVSPPRMFDLGQFDLGQFVFIRLRPWPELGQSELGQFEMGQFDSGQFDLGQLAQI